VLPAARTQKANPLICLVSLTAFREQLGLEPKVDRGPVEFLIIDFSERPSPN
jgi:hypothetical protein